jgi:hypothetical protein
MTTRRTPVRAAVLSVAAFLLGVPAAAPAAGGGPGRQVTVSAGAVDRRQSVVVYAADAGQTGASVRLTGDDGVGVPVQVRPDGQAAFVLPALKAGATRTYREEVVLPPAGGAGPAAAGTAAAGDRLGVTAERTAGGVAVSAGGRPVFTYRGQIVPPPPGFGPEYARGGYLEPLQTPAGIRVTDDYPPNHKHHHGVWAPWTATRFEGRKPDFWNMGQKSGTVEFVDLGPTWSGEVAAGFVAKHRFMDLSAKPEPKAALNETWGVQAYVAGPAATEPGAAAKPPAYHRFDWQSTQTCATDSPLVLPKYYYGGLGVRGNRQWDGAENCAFLTSEGKTRKDGNDAAAKWVALYGKVDGKPAYVAVLCHPGNVRSPQPLRLHPKEPFLCYAPQIAGDMAIEPGKPYVSRYRFVVGDGEPDKGELDRLWADYADPAKVEVR